jgi:hypothetical protein
MKLLGLLGAVVSALTVAGPAAAAAVRPVASATLTPRAVFFADPVHARVDVTVDVRVDDPSRIELSAPLGAWAQLGPTSASTSSAGRLARRRFDLTIVCRTDACVPAGTSQVVRLPAATVTLQARDGKVTRIAVRWPALVVASRLTRAAPSEAEPPFRLQVTPPPARARLSPSGVAWALDAVAALLALAAVSAICLEIRRRRPAPAVSPLQRALALAREAEGRPVADRRRALALLARVAPRPDGGAAAAAATAAWAQDEPSPAAIERIVERIARRGERVGGEPEGSEPGGDSA